MSSFEQDIYDSMTNLIEKGMVYVKLDDEGDELSKEQLEKLWFNMRLRSRLMFSLTEFGKKVAAADEQREQREDGIEVEGFPKYF